MAVVSNCIAEWAGRQPDKLAVVSVGGESLTYSQLYELSQCIAANLSQHLIGLSKSRWIAHDQPPIMLLSADDPISVATVIACNFLGLTVVPMNPAIGTQALKAAREAINASLILYSSQCRRASLEMKTTQCDTVDICTLTGYQEVPLHPIKSEPQYTFLLSLSSGSTGDPKPVSYTDSGKLQRAQSTAAEFSFNQHDIILCASPFYHSLGQRLTFMPLVLGATMVQLPRFSVTAWLDAVAQQRVSVTICVSSHLFALKQFLINKDPR
ncbi:acyl--CoA ligase, partial [bacterium]|nr:acyl--CoA ligase [bacterium]